MFLTAQISFDNRTESVQISVEFVTTKRKEKNRSVACFNRPSTGIFSSFKVLRIFF